ncbi:MAG: response regulator transcription factor [Gemmatimonadetes bacterium]|nr:response regulator transcription factor [Gemmatimonadota bacterium]
MTERRILVVEDEADLANLLAHNLRHEGFDVRTAGDGRDAVSQVAAWTPDLMILDLMLPGLNGFEVLRSVRGTHPELPIIILSARGEEQDKVRAFRLDSDQYVTKPFSLVELLERVHALLRRRSVVGAPPTSDLIQFGDVTVDVAARTIRRAGTTINVSPKAFDLLLSLVRREGRVATRLELLREVWGYGPLVLSRTVDSHIAELRRKLEADAGEPRHVLTVFKHGYRFER